MREIPLAKPAVKPEETDKPADEEKKAENIPDAGTAAPQKKADVPKPEQTRMELRSVQPSNVLREDRFSINNFTGPIKTVDLSRRNSIPQPPARSVEPSAEKKEAPKPAPVVEEIKTQTAAPEPVKAPEPAKPELPPYRVIGVVFKTYILVEVGENLLMIDQHAAHERLQYEKLMARARRGAASQQLLTPIVVSLSAKEMAIVADNLETLSEAGYTVEIFGDRDIQIRAVPFVMGQAELRPLFLEMIQSLSQLKAATIDARRTQIIQMACKTAVKAGDSLSDSEIAALISDMMETGAPPTCPHGRPVVKTISRRDMEKMFKRIQ